MFLRSFQIDTQGYEASVLAGLSETLRDHKIQFLLMEYWPAAIDMFSEKGRGSCEAAQLLKDLHHKHGYELFALKVMGHPTAPAALHDRVVDRPMDDFDAHCRWYYAFEERLRKGEEYKLGYWTE